MANLNWLALEGKLDVKWNPWVVDLEKARVFKSIEQVLKTKFEVFLKNWFALISADKDFIDEDISQTILILSEMYWKKLEIYFVNDYWQPESVYYERLINKRALKARNFLVKKDNFTQEEFEEIQDMFFKDREEIKVN